MNEFLTHVTGSPVFAALAGGAIGALISWFLTRRGEKQRLTNELFRLYHSPDVLVSRNIAWKFMKEEYPGLSLPFYKLFADKDIVDRERYNAINQVVYFWYQLFSMKKRRAIDKKLAREYFSYQFNHWKSDVGPLVENTRQKSQDDKPDWLIIFEKGRMDWLCR